MAPNRRDALSTGAVVAMGLMSPANPAVAARASSGRGKPSAKPPFVLVHGAWHGGWCWRDVKVLLEVAGHKVFTPTLTGLGERAHLREPAPNLTMHIQDVMGLIEAEELTDIVLVGHSYGGMVITGVADRIKSRLRHVVYLDAALPSNGQTMITQNPAVATQAAVEQTVAGLKTLTTDGVWMAPLPAIAFGIPATQTEALAWVGRRLTPHPLPTWTEALALSNNGSEGLSRTYVLCNNPILPQTAFPAHAARIRAGQAGAGWRVIELATGHDAMVSLPQQTADLFLAAARRT
jgi:pimeloyl-ACP methyl ester carboxylesterase